MNRFAPNWVLPLAFASLLAASISGTFRGAPARADGPATAAVSISPDPLTFDGVDVGRSQTKQVFITSVGTSAAAIVAVGQAGRDSSSFSIEQACVGRSLPPGASCAVAVRFTPTKVGTLVSHLYVRSSNACAHYSVIAGGGAAPAQSRASDGCQVVTQTTTQPGQTTIVTQPATRATETRASATSISLTSPATSCASRRVVTLHLNAPSGQRFVKAVVRLNGKVVRRLKRSGERNLVTTVVLKGLPRARFVMNVVATTAKGKSYKRTQHFITCVSGATK